jgi:hypothetical protein
MTHKTKKRFSNLGVATLLLSLALLGIYACNKRETQETDCVKCKQNQNGKTKDVFLNGASYTATVSEPNPQNPFIITVLSNEDMPGIEQSIASVLSTYGLVLPSADETRLFSLALFYTEPGGSSSGVPPSIVLSYHTDLSDQRSYATLWQNTGGGSFILRPDLSGITSMVSRTNFFQIDDLLNLNTSEVLLLVDRPNLPTTTYRTVFQIKLENALNDPSGAELAPNGAGGGSCSSCGAVFNGCCKEDLFGVSCDITTTCGAGSCRVVLNSNGYTFTQQDIDYLYWIRDSVLMKTEQGQKMIDDYYYSGEILAGNISFGFAWKLYRLFGIDLFAKFPLYFSSPMYDGDVLIDAQAHEIIQEMCDEARTVSGDARFQSIITKTETELNQYHNQPFVVIRNAYE